MTNKKALFLAYDQGLEHGPIDFNVHNIDPDYLIHIGVNGGFNGLILQKGIAERYFPVLLLRRQDRHHRGERLRQEYLDENNVGP